MWLQGDLFSCSLSIHGVSRSPYDIAMDIVVVHVVSSGICGKASKSGCAATTGTDLNQYILLRCLNLMIHLICRRIARGLIAYLAAPMALQAPDGDKGATLCMTACSKSSCPFDDIAFSRKLILPGLKEEKIWCEYHKRRLTKGCVDLVSGLHPVKIPRAHAEV
jgi:hypothetical protein